MARSLGLLALAGPCLLLVWLLLPRDASVPLAAAVATIATSWTLAAIVLAGGFDRLPVWAFQPLLAVAPLVITPFVIWSDDASSGFVLLYLWATPYAYCVLSLPHAIGQTVFASACFLAGRLASPYRDEALPEILFDALLLEATILAVGLFGRALVRSMRREERLRTHRERVLAELGRASLDADRLEDVHAAALASARDELGADFATLGELDPDGGLCLAAIVGPPDTQLLATGTPVPGGRASLMGCALDAEVVVTEDVWQDSRLAPQPGGVLDDVHAGIAVAVRGHGGGPGGALGAFSRQRAIFSFDDASFLQSLANLIAAARARFSAEEELRYRALHDPLTGLPNRTLLNDRLERALLHAGRRPSERVALILLDLDRFKQVNDSLGHPVGDRLLIGVARRLQRLMRAGDTLARMGGDEFVIVAENVCGEADALELARRIAQAFDEPLVVDGRPLRMRASTGVALSTDHTTADELLANADAAMYHCKGLGQGGAARYDDGMRASGDERLRVEQELHRALEAGELRVHYQPIVDARSRGCRGLEALVRWEHPARGLIGPGEFIAAAEASGLIVPLGAQVLRRALGDVARWRRRAGLEHLTVSVNVSTHQLHAPGFVRMVREALDDARLPPDALTLEITERVLLPEGPGVAAAIALAELGVTLALDDFGTGYSSLSTLRALPVAVVKIDRSFIARVGVDEADTAVVSGVVRMAQGAGIAVVAEGVETAQQAECIVELGCDAAQGYFYARPDSAGRIDAYLGAATAGAA